MTVIMERRLRWCDGSPDGRPAHKCEQSRQYYLHVRQWEPRTHVQEPDRSYTLPAGERDSEFETWLCDACAAEMCATHCLARHIYRDVQVWHEGKYSHTERRHFGVWKRAA
jgi:hypothetical protein